ncbi:FxsA family membrane protein [Streptomyces sp. DSM 41982]|uniref:FxsA family membrane protein n=1 Tax=Streptomyces evansiae TaxID=3075535 RepID=A0ABD5E2U0_9ACTN|nr:FxsA family membrane protein [Streptomyces sp. DSM 41982]MDT0415756.1 FxsA family membrane protein [Streptomyces sp. DSM 41982]
MTPSTPPPTATRSGLRRWLPLGVAAWIVIEIWLLILVGEAAGGLVVVVLLAAGIIGGGAVVKRAGRRAFGALTRTLQQPAAEAVPEGRAEGNGFLMLAGLLLMIPGLLSDVAGLVLLVPGIRGALSRRVERAMQRKLDEATGGAFGTAYTRARTQRPDGKVVRGEVVHEDTPAKPRDEDEGPRPPLAP